MSSSKTSSSSLQTIKVLLCGNSSTGKTSCLRRFVDDVFNEDQTQTIGVEFGAKVVTLNGQRVRLTIWDTAGQERYRGVTRSYYRGAVACLIVYDITNRESYEQVPQWLTDVRQLSGTDCSIMLIGNKTDLISENIERRKVSHNEAAVFAQENGLMHLETSAQSGEFVADAFLRVARNALMKQIQGGGGRSVATGGEQGNKSRLISSDGGGDNNANDDINYLGEHDSIRHDEQENASGKTVRLTENTRNEGGEGEGGANAGMCGRC